MQLNSNGWNVIEAEYYYFIIGCSMLCVEHWQIFHEYLISFSSVAALRPLVSRFGPYRSHSMKRLGNMVTEISFTKILKESPGRRHLQAWLCSCLLLYKACSESDLVFQVLISKSRHLQNLLSKRKLWMGKYNRTENTVPFHSI